jgi:pyruvate-formate lyase-activating enzyme
VKEKYLTGVTFSGGDPFQQAEAFAKLAILLKQQRINI